MAKSIQELRRERGFRNSREFAHALGVSPSSMSRYDHDSTTIPVKVAWAMADLLGCSIDEVLGREHVTSGRSELQEDFDSLSPESQLLVSEFMEFAKVRDARLRDNLQAQQALKFDRLCQFYEKLFYQSLLGQVEFGEPVVFATFSRERASFREFVVRMAEEKRKEHLQEDSEERDEGVIEAIMDSYDRRHGRSMSRYDMPGTAFEYTGGPPS